MAVLGVCVLAMPGAAQAKESGFLVSVQESRTDAVGYVYFGPPKLVRLDAQGKPAATLTDGTLSDYDPTVGPDETVYFGRYSGGYVWAYGAGFVSVPGQADIWRMRLDGSGAEALTTTPQWDEWGPAVSEDGRYMAWERYDTPNYNLSEIVVRDMETGRETVIARGEWTYLSGPSFTPDGRVVFVQEKDKLHELAIANLDGTDRRTIYRAKAGAHNPEVSPDGTRIVFDKYDSEDSAEFQNIAVIDIDGTNEHVLTKGKAYPWAPTWSPDATEVLYTYNDLRGASRLFRVPAGGGAARSLGVTAFWALASKWFGARPSIFPAPPSWSSTAPGGPTPATPAPPASPLKLKAAKARPDRSGRLALRVACVAKTACRGRVALIVESAGPPRAIATGKVALKSGRKTTLRVKLSSGARRMLKSRRRLVVRAEYAVGKRVYRAGTLQLLAR